MAGSNSADEFRQLMAANCVSGEKTNEGYYYLPNAGISVQGQDANGAWREKQGAAFPGVTGQFTIAGG